MRRDDIARQSNRALTWSLGAIVERWWGPCILGLVGAIAAMGISFLQAPVYQSSVTLYVSSGSKGDAANDAYQGGLASEQRMMSYASLVTSDAVLESAVEASGVGDSVADIRRAVTVTTASETVLMTISVAAGDPQESALLANSIGASLVRYVETLETPVGGGSPLAKATVVTPAKAADSPVSPRPRRNALLGLILGFLAGCAVAMWRATADRFVRSTADLEALGEAPVLATVPKDSALNSDYPIDFSSSISSAAEAVRRVRTNLAFIGVDSPPRSILISSANPNEGKTTLVINLGAALSEAGKSVVVVDADLRRPSIAARLGVNGDVGLTNYLRGDGQIVDFTQRSETAPFDILTSGEVPPNPSELLASQRAAAVVDYLLRQYDIVIVDSAPLLPVTDSALIASHVDGVLMVVRSGQTSKGDYERACGELSKTDSRVTGVVLNSVVDTEASYGYGSYGAYGVRRAEGAETEVQTNV